MLAIRMAPMLHVGNSLKLEDHSISKGNIKVALNDSEYQWLSGLFKANNKTIVIDSKWIEQVYAYSKDAKESLKAFSLPSIYRLDDSSIAADFG